MRQILISLRVLAVLSLVTGVFYPLLVTFFAKTFVPEKAEGQLLRRDSNVVGSELLAQKFSSPGFFWPRPSASDFNGGAAGATNLAATSLSLQKQVRERAELFKDGHPAGDIPPELLFASGSGLDPHLSPAAAEYQIERVARHRKLEVSTVRHLVQSLTEDRQWGILGKSRVNIFKLNRALEEMSP